MSRTVAVPSELLDRVCFEHPMSEKFDQALNELRSVARRAEVPAATLTSKEQNLSRIRALCTAYESGFGHGIKRDSTCNPYATFSDESLAYGFGREAGEKRSAVETRCSECGGSGRVNVIRIGNEVNVPCPAYSGHLKTKSPRSDGEPV